MHHIVSDGWSMGVLVRELAALYDAFAAGQPSPLPELPVQYADFAVWQRALARRARCWSAQLAYWREQLAGAPPLLELPTDRPRPARAEPAAARAAASPLPAELSRRRSSARPARGRDARSWSCWPPSRRCSHRYSGQDDLCVGTPIAGRTRPRSRR